MLVPRRIDHFVHYPADPETQALLKQVLGALKTLSSQVERLTTMNEALQTAVTDLVAEVQDSTGKLASIKTYLEGVPELVATAVAEALAAHDVAATEAAATIANARTTVSDSVDAALAAINANPGPGEDTTPGTGEDTTAGEETTSG